MKRSMLALAPLLLAACASFAPEGAYVPPSRIGVDGYNPLLVSPSSPHYPNVKVDPPYAIVDQEPIHIRASDNKVAIEWALPIFSSYTFPDDAVVVRPASGVTAPRNLDCRRVSTRRFRCTYDYTSNGKYLYTLKVTDGTNTYETDPTIMNN